MLDDCIYETMPISPSASVKPITYSSNILLTVTPASQCEPPSSRPLCSNVSEVEKADLINEQIGSTPPFLKGGIAGNPELELHIYAHPMIPTKPPLASDAAVANWRAQHPSTTSGVPAHLFTDENPACTIKGTGFRDREVRCCPPPTHYPCLFVAPPPITSSNASHTPMSRCLTGCVSDCAQNYHLDQSTWRSVQAALDNNGDARAGSASPTSDCGDERCHHHF